MTIFPVLTSTVAPEYLGDFIKKTYGLGDDYQCTLIRTGINHTYLISNNDTKYVARLYCYNWRSKKEIQEELKWLSYLQKNNLSISFPIPDQVGNQIQELQAPEGLRYLVLFSFAKGEKMRFMNHETCFAMGSIMSEMHRLTMHKKMDRVQYHTETLLHKPYDLLKKYFSEDLPEMNYLKGITQEIADQLIKNESKFQNGMIHLDIWYDNVSVGLHNQITLFDFDNCGHGWFILDIGYFCKQLFFIESDRQIYQSKRDSFLKGYCKNRDLSPEELSSISVAGASVFIHYLGIQAQRFDWSNIFFTENYLKMMVTRIQSWLASPTNHTNSLFQKTSPYPGAH